MIINDIRGYEAVAYIILVIYDSPVDGINPPYILFEECVVYLRTANHKSGFDAVAAVAAVAAVDITQGVFDSSKYTTMFVFIAFGNLLRYLVIIVCGYDDVYSVFQRGRRTRQRIPRVFTHYNTVLLVLVVATHRDIPKLL